MIELIRFLGINFQGSSKIRGNSKNLLSSKISCHVAATWPLLYCYRILRKSASYGNREISGMKSVLDATRVD